MNKHLHTPIHFFCDNSPYFITAAIYEKRLLLANEDIKAELLRLIHKVFQEKDWILDHWVISQSCFLISQTTNCKKQVWWNYWDYCPRNEK